MDPFNRMPAGWTLTQPPGKWGWESPPRFVNPDEAVSHILDQIEDDDTQLRFLKLMFAGVSIEELVRTIGIGGFSEGFFTPDVAELIKPPLVVYFLGLAAENNIPVKLFATPDGMPARDTGPDDFELFEMMKLRNPEFANHVLESLQSAGEEPVAALDQGFLTVAEDVVAGLSLGENGMADEYEDES
jgi:hypothetical protein